MKFFKTLASSFLLSAIICSSTTAEEGIQPQREDAASHNASAYFYDTQGHWAESIFNIMAEEGYFKGTEDGIFSPDRLMTKAEFITVFARVVSPESDFTLTEGGPWYTPFYQVVSELPYFTSDFAEEVLFDTISGLEANFALNTWKTYLETGLVDQDLFLTSHENATEESLRFYETGHLDKLTRGDCAALLFDYMIKDVVVVYDEGIVPLGTEAPSPDDAIPPSFSDTVNPNQHPEDGIPDGVHLDGFIPNIDTPPEEGAPQGNPNDMMLPEHQENGEHLQFSDLLPPQIQAQVPTIPDSAFPVSVIPLEWSADPNATGNQNNLARVLANHSFGSVITLDGDMFFSMYPAFESLGRDDSSDCVCDYYGYASAMSVTTFELAAVKIKNELYLDEAISAFQNRIDEQVVGGALSSSSIEQWENHSRIFYHDGVLFLIIHPEVDNIIADIESWTLL